MEKLTIKKSKWIRGKSKGTSCPLRSTDKRNLKNYIGWIINAHKFSKKYNAKDLLIKDLIKMFSVVELKNPCMNSCKYLYFCSLSKYHKGKCRDIMGLTWTKEEND